MTCGFCIQHPNTQTMLQSHFPLQTVPEMDQLQVGTAKGDQETPMECPACHATISAMQIFSPAALRQAAAGGAPSKASGQGSKSAAKHQGTWQTSSKIDKLLAILNDVRQKTIQLYALSLLTAIGSSQASLVNSIHTKMMNIAVKHGFQYFAGCSGLEKPMHGHCRRY